MHVDVRLNRAGYTVYKDLKVGAINLSVHTKEDN